MSMVPETSGVRCRNCHTYAEYGKPQIGLPLVTDTIRIIQSDRPALDIAHVTRCCKCNTVYSVSILGKAAEEYGFTEAKLRAVLRQTRGTNFRLQELQAGTLAGFKLVEPAKPPKPAPGDSEDTELF